MGDLQFLKQLSECVRSILAALVAVEDQIFSRHSGVVGHPERCSNHQGGQTHLRNRDDLSLALYPNQQWVIDLDVISSTVFQYECHTLDVTLEYSKPGQNTRRYKETSSICFDDYTSFLVYISETDELRKAIKNLDSNIVKIGHKIEKALKIDTSSQVQTTSFVRLQDEYSRTIVTDIPKQQANPGESDLSCDSSEKN